MRKYFYITWAAPIAAAGLLIFAPALKAVEVPDSDHVTKLLSDVKTQAFQLKEDAEYMESFTRSTASWETQAVQITLIKEHVNDLFKQEMKLMDARPNASVWQKRAIDRIMPFLDELGGYTSAVIEHLNASPRNLNTAEYKDFLEANADYAGDLAAMISDFVSYGKAKNRVEYLNDKLELPVSE
jgi:hypothetical protein